MAMLSITLNRWTTVEHAQTRFSSTFTRLRCSCSRIVSSEFDMKDLGPLSYFLGIAVTHHIGGLFLSQRKSDIAYVVQQVCLYVHDLRESHVQALKCIVRYIQGTLDHDLHLYPSSTSTFLSYTDVDWGGCPDTKRSTSGYYVFLELHCPIRKATLIYCDNVSVIYLFGNPVQHQCTKHIEMDIHFVCEKVARREVRVLHVSSRYQIAEIFTKGLPLILFEDFQKNLSVHTTSHFDCRGSRYSTYCFAKKSLKKSKREGPEAPGDLLDDKFIQNDKLGTSLNPASQNSNPLPSRSTVFQACIVTSGLIAALGIVIRQVSHVASMEGLPVLDCSTEVSFGFEMWHLELISGLVVLISSCRYLLLKTWPDFAESSEAANQQVLSSLQPLDYILVAFLPGISEELLFRGAILPLLGMNWKSVGVAALIFGVLHLGNGRKYSFAIWATFVGVAYGYATILSSSLAVPMASHAVNNLIGGLLWRYTSDQKLNE
ncbi:hypothetical protein VNO78_10823 [Psophocarpus tetragonolobus]|uniref:CAAX prenyl protease 2/Lysostaphin resistance protein A-like domain-containing protein n=1 Tax=Psophocarpus tetragonolobus TaxID=3891 RepID=A0AAN9SN32_PSOTE